eukprot:2744967-Rhodomonas_salina.2
MLGTSHIAHPRHRIRTARNVTSQKAQIALQADARYPPHSPHGTACAYKKQLGSTHSTAREWPGTSHIAQLASQADARYQPWGCGAICAVPYVQHRAAFANQP